MPQKDIIPQNLQSLYFQEEQLREKALEIVGSTKNLQLHINIVERAMDLADMLRQFESEDEDLKVIQVLGMRTFNAFGASLKLALSGYGQNAALIMRDLIETAFLLDLFQGDRALIEQWRLADKKARMRQFAPVKVRKALDERDGFTSKKRAEIYELFSELAGHPNVKSVWMMRPEKNGDAVIGPFIETTALEAVLSEMGRLAIQVGEMMNEFFPENWDRALPARVGFAEAKKNWLGTFYPAKT